MKKTEIYFVLKIKADFLRALSHSSRLHILQVLRHEERSVVKLIKQTGIEQSNLSRHLSILKRAGILGSLPRQRTVVYFVKNTEVFNILSSVSQVLKKNILVNAQSMESLEG